MNKVLGIISIICAVFLVIGVGIFFLGISLGGSRNFQVSMVNNKLVSSTKEQVENTISVEEFDSLNVEVESAKLVIKKGDANQVYYNIDKRMEPVIESENGTLKVTSKSDEGTFVFLNWTILDDNESIIEITTTNEDLLNLVVDSASGSVTVEDLAIEGTIESTSGSTTITNAEGSGILIIDSTSGSTSISDSDFSSLKIDKNSGSIKLMNVTANDVILDSDSGSQSLNSCNITKFATSRESGSLSVVSSSFEEIKAEATSGTTKYEECSIGDYQGSTVSGSTTLNIQGKESDYNYKFDITSGSVKIDGEKKSDDYEKDNGAANTINIETTSGSTEITFYE